MPKHINIYQQAIYNFKLFRKVSNNLTPLSNFLTLGHSFLPETNTRGWQQDYQTLVLF